MGTHEVILSDDIRLLANNDDVEVDVFSLVPTDYVRRRSKSGGPRIYSLGKHDRGLRARFTDTSQNRIPLLSNFVGPRLWRVAFDAIADDPPDVWYSAGTAFSAFNVVQLAEATKRPVVYFLTDVHIGWNWWREEQEIFNGYRLPLTYLLGHLARNALQEIIRRPAFARRLLRHVTRILTISEGIAAEARALDSNLPISVLPLGIKSGPRPPPIPRNATFAYAGHLWQGRGVLDLLRAFSRVHKLLPDAHLLVGDSNVQAVTEQFFEDTLEKEQLRNSVRRLGIQTNLLESIYWPSRAVVLPYRDNPSIKLFEALTCGRPVITTRVGWINEIFDHDSQAALLVPPGDIDALTEALLLVAQDESLATSLAERGNSLIQRYFNPDRRRDLLVEVFSEVCQ